VVGSARAKTINAVVRGPTIRWRGEFRRRGESLAEDGGFLPVEITAAHNVTSAAAATATVEIVLTNGRRLRGSDRLSPTGSDGLSPTGLAQLIRVPESA
jgi:transposase